MYAPMPGTPSTGPGGVGRYDMTVSAMTLMNLAFHETIDAACGKLQPA